MSGGRHDYGLFFASALVPLLALGGYRIFYRILSGQDQGLPKSVSGFGKAPAGIVIPPRFDHGLGLLSRRNNTRIFAATQVIVLLASFAMLLLAPAIVRGARAESVDPSALFVIVSGGSFTLLALLYASRKGDLGWVETLSSEHQAEAPVDADEAAAAEEDE